MNKITKIILIIILFFLISFSISRSINKVDLTNKIVFIPLKGTIVVENGNSLLLSNTISSSDIIGYLEKAEKDKTIKGIILEINSGGGTVVASKEIADKVKGMEKPVVAWIREIGASGAYWIASSADKIVADPLSITGSIGVIGSYLEFSELMEEYGVGYERLISGEYKDTGSSFRKLNDREKQLMQKRIDTIHNYFIKEVSKNRDKDISTFADGMFYLGEEAKKIGLIDELGSKELAVNITKELAGIKEAKLVTFKTKKSLLDILEKIFSNFSFYLGKGIKEGFSMNNENFIPRT